MTGWRGDASPHFVPFGLAVAGRIGFGGSWSFARTLTLSQRGEGIWFCARSRGFVLARTNVFASRYRRRLADGGLVAFHEGAEVEQRVAVLGVDAEHAVGGGEQVAAADLADEFVAAEHG